ncbi:hypothetical protein HanRHA438_Chr00c51g0858741 [Helianthus annuus]|nr:hypothetical protein HanRHA438_Chr00c51g0858741 [Helianthus annuus]
MFFGYFISSALRSCLLSESLQVTTFKQLPEYHNCGEDIKKCLYVVATLQTKDNDEVYLSDCLMQ